MRLALVLVAVATACVDLSVEQPHNAEIAPPPGAERAVARGVVAWEQRLGDLPIAPTFRWFDGECLRYGAETGGCRVSVTLFAECRDCPWDARHAETHALASLAETRNLVIAHELLHWALWELEGDEDAGHHSSLWGEQDAISLAIDPR